MFMGSTGRQVGAEVMEYSLSTVALYGICQTVLKLFGLLIDPVSLWTSPT